LIAGKIDLQEGKEPKHSAVRMNRIQDAWFHYFTVRIPLIYDIPNHFPNLPIYLSKSH
jgi:hypothetical protein